MTRALKAATFDCFNVVGRELVMNDPSYERLYGLRHTSFVN